MASISKVVAVYRRWYLFQVVVWLGGQLGLAGWMVERQPDVRRAAGGGRRAAVGGRRSAVGGRRSAAGGRRPAGRRRPVAGGRPAAAVLR